MKEKTALFYVALRDNFSEKFRESQLPSIFEDQADPYIQAAGRIHSNRKYPVMEVSSDSDIVILDDQGLPFRTRSSLFKYVH